MEIHELGPLFEAVQMSSAFPDGKTFPDCIPNRDLKEVNRDYLKLKDSPGFDLQGFVMQNFQMPESYSAAIESDARMAIKKHVVALWDILTRQPDEKGGSLIPLPHPYVVPGGRFREIYYWDSYFTMLGLRVSKRVDLMEHMIANFAHLIDTIGYIPNGNRTYFLGRSQPPYFSVMVSLLQQEKGDHVLERYLPQLEREYAFWMKGKEDVNEKHQAIQRVVWLPEGEILNRYWDEHVTPRPEAFKEDVELAGHTHQRPQDLFRHIRAAAESGWDFSSRWFKESHSFGSIHTTDIIPVDLNCLLLHLEQTLAQAYSVVGKPEKHNDLLHLANQRKVAIQKYCWSEENKFYFDYDFIENKPTPHYTLAGVFPLFFQVAIEAQARHVADHLKQQFLKPGGLTTTLKNTGQQWDAPNGWAPLQWTAYQGLLNYGHLQLASEIRQAWLNTNQKVYEFTGKMTEKYNVYSEDAAAGGGEYPNQDGFGWTNGVFLALLEGK